MEYEGIRDEGAEETVECGYKVGRADGMAVPCSLQGTASDGVLVRGEREAVKETIVVGFSGSRDEFRIADPVRADRGDGDAARFEFCLETAAVAQQEGFGCCIRCEICDGLECSTGTDFQDMGAFFHMWQADFRQQDGCTAIEVDHTGCRCCTDGLAAADTAETCSIYEPVYGEISCLLQTLLYLLQGFFLREVERQQTAGQRQGASERFEPFPSPGDEPDFLESWIFGKQPGVFCPESARSTGDDGDAHDDSPLYRFLLLYRLAFFVYNKRYVIFSNNPADRAGSGGKCFE